LAERLNVSMDFIQRVEGSKLYPSLSKIKDIADTLKVVSMGDLLAGDVLLDNIMEVAQQFDIDRIIRTLNTLAGLPEDDGEDEEAVDDWWKK